VPRSRLLFLYSTLAVIREPTNLLSMKRVLTLSIILALISLLITGYAGKDKPHISFSFDDGSTRDKHIYKASEWNSMIRKQLKDNHVQAVWFVAGKSMDSKEGKELLQKWVVDGHIIANHTYSHFNYNDSLISCKTFIQDIQKCDSLIGSYKNYSKIFRFPYLNGGNTISKRDSLNYFLLQNDYKQGWVTIDNAEWFLNNRLIQYLKQNPDADISRFKDYYVNNIFEMAEYYNRVSLKNNKRQIKHILLLHFNLTSALFLNDLIEKFKNEGWIIDNYNDAIHDEIYSKQLDGLPAEQRLIYICKKSKKKVQFQNIMEKISDT
jgi:peptidoglycan/xylan/chitin deacetylase (PgdA/CDA1 family)